MSVTLTFSLLRGCENDATKRCGKNQNCKSNIMARHLTTLVMYWYGT